MEILYTVRINTDTVGTIHSDTIQGQPLENFLGEIVTVHLFDENVNPIEKSGRLTEILSISVLS